MSTNAIIAALGVAFAVGLAVYTYFNEPTPQTQYAYGTTRSQNQNPPHRPRSRPQRRHRDYRNEGYDCTVCLEPLQGTELIQTIQCGHQFHMSCLRRLRESGSKFCPNCREEFA